MCVVVAVTSPMLLDILYQLYEEGVGAYLWPGQPHLLILELVPEW